MTVAEICISAYLIVGLVSAILIWTTMIASKRKDSRPERTSHDFLQAGPFRERKTKPSRIHL
jgi:hypothetical protein